MTVYFINYGHFKSFKEANDCLKRKFPKSAVFSTDDGFTLRICSAFSKENAEELISEAPEGFWISQ